MCDKSEDLLHPREHPRAQHEQAQAPRGEFGWDVCAPPHRALLLEPHRGERLLDVFEVQKKTEEELVAQNGSARNDERKWEFDVEVELESVDPCASRALGRTNKVVWMWMCETDLTEVFSHPYLFLSCGARHARRQRYHSRRQ